MQQVKGVQVACENSSEADTMLYIANECMCKGTIMWEQPLVKEYWMIIGEPKLENQLLMYITVLAPHFARAAAYWYKHLSEEPFAP
jgi:hypothetical protein